MDFIAVCMQNHHAHTVLLTTHMLAEWQEAIDSIVKCDQYFFPCHALVFNSLRHYSSNTKYKIYWQQFLWVQVTTVR